MAAADTTQRPDAILTTSEAARLLGVATSTVQLWMENGAIRSWKTPGGHRRTRLGDIASLLPPGHPCAPLAQASLVPGGLGVEYQALAQPDYPVGPDEVPRLAALAATGLLDSATEERFDRLVRLAALVTGSPIALLSLLTATRQWFKARVGVDASETPRAWAFCSHAVLGDGPFVVEDAANDPRFRNNPLVLHEPRIRFYAGMPLRDRNGIALGTLCVIDKEPRRLRSVELRALEDLAAIATAELRASR
jgi:excisionase family DNA binding protein